MTAKYSLARVVAELGHIPLDKLKPIDVERYKTKRLKSAKSATVAKEVRMLKAAMRRATLLQAIEKNPIELIKPPSVQESKAIDFFSSEQLAQIYANADRYAAVWKFAVNTGLRRKELAKARRSDVRVTAGNEKVLKVESIESGERDELGRSTEHLTNKSRKVRFVPLNAAALEALDQLGEDKLVPLSAKGLDKAWDRVRRRTGLLGGIHWLRHTFASQLVMKGAALRTVQNLMGHATIAVTERYAHLAPGQTTEAVKLISLYVTEMPGSLSQLLSQRIAPTSKYLKVQTGEVPERPKGLPC